ncbi:hypothetical protein AV656_06110 [Bhargavaea cecembensis]|uniref:DUF4230 domain-containing protein n=1 Tax=Bhargavaea cecembensis TaxID=394098 RepID=A0A163FDZ4_9BACL|nr:DUF4230 domain-containing protein [Bhargavaea cecembensis]KZE38477.1 hypothetical protein AV656_06110 [Bhargavaea cecembensis]
MAGRNGKKGRAEEESAVTVEEVWDTSGGRSGGKRRGRALKGFLWIAIPLLLLAVILPVVALRMLTGGSTFTEQKGAVVQSVQELSELATAEAFTKVIVERTDNELFGKSIGIDIPGTKRNLLVIIPGSIKAGIDFGNVREEDITIDENAKTVTLTVPEPTFLGEPVIRFDEAEVYSQEGLFRERPDIQEGYELAEDAQKMIIEEATEQGVLIQARENAEKTLQQMYSLSGYDVQVEFKE